MKFATFLNMKKRARRRRATRIQKKKGKKREQRTITGHATTRPKFRPPVRDASGQFVST